VAVTDRDLCIAAAIAGATVVRVRYGRGVAHDRQALTAVALDAEQAILEVLRAARPDDAVRTARTGPTGGPTGSPTGSPGGRTWLVDPLSGSLAPAAGTPEVAVSLALRDGSETAVAVSADPFAGEVFWTDGRGAYARRGDVDERLTPWAGSRLVDVNLDPPPPHSPAFRAARLLTDARLTGRLRPAPTATTLAVSRVAAGRRAAYVTDGDLRDSVPFAAGIALCRAAGCVVTGLRGQRLHTGAGGLLVAADHETHAALLAAVEDQFAAAR
jgi:myo-inositol-1(or 4)-monophosphatase